MNYRACYHVTPDKQGEVVLTAPEHANLSDDELLTEALAEARRVGIVNDETDLATWVEYLRIGDWSE